MKSAKRLNRKLVKSRLTKKRRQVGRGFKNYTVKYKEPSIQGKIEEKEIEIKIETSDEGESTVTCESDLVMEKRLPTLDQFITYAKNFLPGGSQASNPNTGLFITKENESQNINFYKLKNNEIIEISIKISKDGNTIDIGDIGADLSINGINITHADLDETEPILIPEPNTNFRRIKTKAIRKKSINPRRNASNDLPPLPNEIKVNYEPIHDAPKKKISSNNKPVNVSTLYSTPKKLQTKPAPALPPRMKNTKPYTGPGPSRFT